MAQLRGPWVGVAWVPTSTSGGSLGAMRVSVTVRDESTSGKAIVTHVLNDIPAAITLCDLIRTRVRDEVARFNADRSDPFAGLVVPEGAELATGGGYTVPGGRTIDWERQADLAIEAFGRNGFFVIVDGAQVTELDAALTLTADSEIRFVRLIALVGG